MALRRRKYSIQAAVKEIVMQDRKILKQMQAPYFNTSAYARQIQKRVERLVGQKVKLNTITVSLKRLQRRLDELLQEIGAVDVDFSFSDLQVKAPVVVARVTLDKKTRTLISAMFTDKQADELFWGYFLSDIGLLAVKKERAGELRKVLGEFELLDGDFAMLRLKVDKGNQVGVINTLANKMEEDNVNTVGFGIFEEYVVFIVEYSELIKVLAWFG